MQSVTAGAFWGTIKALSVLVFAVFFSSQLWAGEVVTIIPLEFGTVDLNPAGCEVIINAKNGEATPTAANTVVYGGSSGKLTVRAQVPEQVYIEYSDSITLWAGTDTLTVNGIQTYSQHNNEYLQLDGGNVPLDIYLGGRLILNGDEPNVHYSGTLRVELTFSVL